MKNNYFVINNYDTDMLLRLCRESQGTSSKCCGGFLPSTSIPTRAMWLMWAVTGITIWPIPARSTAMSTIRRLRTRTRILVRVCSPRLGHTHKNTGCSGSIFWSVFDYNYYIS